MCHSGQEPFDAKMSAVLSNDGSYCYCASLDPPCLLLMSFLPPDCQVRRRFADQSWVGDRRVPPQQAERGTQLCAHGSGREQGVVQCGYSLFASCLASWLLHQAPDIMVGGKVAMFVSLWLRVCSGPCTAELSALGPGLEQCVRHVHGLLVPLQRQRLTGTRLWF